MSSLIYVPLILFMVIVAPLWIIFHYALRLREAKVISSEDEAILRELWDNANRLDDRINTIERILDADIPDWRNRS